MQTARLFNNVITEFLVPVIGFTLAQCFHSELLAQCVSAPDNAQVGWVYSNGAFAAPVIPPLTAAQLAAYANNKQWALKQGGYTLTIAGTPLNWATDGESIGLITGQVVDFQQLSGAPTSVDWQFATGFVTIQSADFIAAAAQINAFIRDTFTALKAVLTAIAAGTITTTAEIDAAAWPSAVSTVAA